ncbi:reverse transcriptase domain-containing protein [Tanacetum coccineum]
MVDSTCKSEYITACEASKEAIWMKIFIGDLGVVPTMQDPIEIFYDNESAVTLTKEPKDHRMSKHIERKYHFVQSKVEEGHVIVKHTRLEDNPADSFTKALAKSRYDEHARSIGLKDNIKFWLHRGRVVEFEDAPNKDGSRVEREFDGRRPSKRRVEYDGSHGGNLPPLLIAHLGRSENGQPSQLTLTSRYRGNQPLTNLGANIPPNGSDNSSDLVIIRVRISRRQVNQGRLPDLTHWFLKKAFMASRRGPSRSLRRGNPPHKDRNPELSHRQGSIMVGGKPFNMEHKLNEYNHIEPVKQKKRGLAHERNEAACKEVDELTKAGILREVKYQTWIDNPVIGYFQIQMAEGDEDKTTFFTKKEVFCYRKMPFGLKNAGETYQRLLDKVLNDEIGRNLEAYVDDMLNPKKYSFGVEEGPFFGHLITKQGIKANPLKFKEITDLKPPRTLKEIQSLNGNLVSLSCFLLKGADKSLPFFKALKSITNRKTIQKGKETSSDLLRKQGVIRGSIKLPIIGEAHISYRPCCKETSKIAKLAIKLREHDIKFKGCNSVKGRILADFLAETPYVNNKDTNFKKLEAANKAPKSESTWKLYTNRASSSDGSGVGLILVSPKGKEYTYALRFEFETTNNKSEYEALLAGLLIEEEMEIKDLAIFIDSQLVANQAKNVIQDIPDGSCMFNAKPHFMVVNVMKQGYYWPSMYRDAAETI